MIAENVHIIVKALSKEEQLKLYEQMKKELKPKEVSAKQMSYEEKYLIEFKEWIIDNKILYPPNKPKTK